MPLAIVGGEHRMTALVEDGRTAREMCGGVQ